MRNFDFSKVEQTFFDRSGRTRITSEIPYIVVQNFQDMGHMTALRFLEWVADNPEGVISLPTGKTPEYFIKWTSFHLNNWDTPKAIKLREDNGLFLSKKPSLARLQFVQIDEFYPIRPKQHNSFYDYVSKLYLRDFGIDPTRAQLINCEEIPLAEGKSFSEIFPDNKVDLTLRNRAATNKLEHLQQVSIFSIDNWCVEYEQKIRDKGGIGFFLGGIGPDGHIAFNTLGSDLYSTTRLTATNFETQAASAGDLGGMELSRSRLVITIGLGTITYNPNCVGIIFAAGESKSKVVKDALENKPCNLYPASVLQRQKNARFYLTEGAAVRLKDTIDKYYKDGEWTFQKTEQSIFSLCERINKYARKLELEDLQNDEYCSLIPNLSLDHVKQVIQSTKDKMQLGLQTTQNTRFLHTGPHHNDIMISLFPNITQQLRQASNTFHFAIFTSGYNAVTNEKLIQVLNSTLEFIKDGKIQMLKFPDFFEKGYLYKKDKDVSHFLNNVAEEDETEQLRGVCHRIVRSVVEIYGIKSDTDLIKQITKTIENLSTRYGGEKDSSDIQVLKSQLREYEEELVWAHFGVKVENIEHLRLNLHTYDGFDNSCDRRTEIQPVLELLRRTTPDTISVAFDPETSGPGDTHYKVLQVIAEALREWRKETDLSKIKIIGYRNMKYRFMPSEATVFTPASLNSMAVLDTSFKNCYMSQVDASFPSYEHDGTFCALSRKIWVKQFKQIQLVLGKDYFYENDSPKIRATHGMVLHKEMNLDEFLNQAEKLRKYMEQ